METNDGNVTRLYPRIPLQTQVHYLSDSLSIVEETRNLSLGGMFIASGLLDEVGTKGQVHVYIPGRITVPVAHCRVRWSTLDRDADAPPDTDEQGMGIEFLDCDPEFREALLDLLGPGALPDEELLADLLLAPPADAGAA